MYTVAIPIGFPKWQILIHFSFESKEAEIVHEKHHWSIYHASLLSWEKKSIPQIDRYTVLGYCIIVQFLHNPYIVHR